MKDAEFLEHVRQEIHKIESQQGDPKLRRSVQSVADAVDRAGERIANAILILAESLQKAEKTTSSTEMPPHSTPRRKGLSVHVKSTYLGHQEPDDLG